MSRGRVCGSCAALQLGLVGLCEDPSTCTPALFYWLMDVVLFTQFLNSGLFLPFLPLFTGLTQLLQFFFRKLCEFPRAGFQVLGGVFLWVIQDLFKERMKDPSYPLHLLLPPPPPAGWAL